MNKGIILAGSLILGGVAGFIFGKMITQKKSDARADAEIESVKRKWAEKNAKNEEEKEDPKEEVKKITNDRGYGRYPMEKSEYKYSPRVISPDEYGSIPEYEQESLTYYRDGTLTDDTDHPMSNIEIAMSVGTECLNHFGEYEEDSVFVRNDKTKTDYEILLDARTYAEVLEEKPYLKD